jgi:hypothetical protein
VRRIRPALALLFVVAGLTAAAAALKSQTCSCSGGLPYDVIALASAVSAAAALGVYLALSAGQGRS